MTFIRIGFQTYDAGNALRRYVITRIGNGWRIEVTITAAGRGFVPHMEMAAVSLVAAQAACGAYEQSLQEAGL